MIATIIILSLFVIFLLYGCYNLNRQIELLEDAIASYHESLVNIRSLAIENQTLLRQIDINKSFESDDEVGQIFTNIKEISDQLSKYVVEIYESK